MSSYDFGQYLSLENLKFVVDNVVRTLELNPTAVLSSATSLGGCFQLDPVALPVVKIKERLEYDSMKSWPQI